MQRSPGSASGAKVRLAQRMTAVLIIPLGPGTRDPNAFEAQPPSVHIYIYTVTRAQNLQPCFCSAHRFAPATKLRVVACTLAVLLQKAGRAVAMAGPQGDVRDRREPAAACISGSPAARTGDVTGALLRSRCRWQLCCGHRLAALPKWDPNGFAGSEPMLKLERDCCVNGEGNDSPGPTNCSGKQLLGKVWWSRCCWR